MTRENLQLELSGIVADGWLKPLYADEQFSVYECLGTACIGIRHDDSEVPMGYLLTRAEADLIIGCVCEEALGQLGENEEPCLTLDKDTLRLFGEFRGRKKLLRRIRKAGFEKTSDDATKLDVVPGLQRYMAVLFTQFTREHMRKQKQEYRRCLKITAFIGAVSLAVMLIATVCLGTSNAREQWNPERPAAVFDDQTADAPYVCAQADILAEYVVRTTKDLSTGERSVNTYYLFGNTQTKECGIVTLTESAQAYALLEGASSKVLEAPVNLYGDTVLFPSFFTPPQEEENAAIVIPGGTFELPDGTTITTPSQIIPSIQTPEVDELLGNLTEYCEQEAFTLFTQHGFSQEDVEAIGTVYLRASLQPQRTPLWINTVLDKVFFVCLIVLFLTWGAAIVYAFKADRAKDLVSFFSHPSAARRLLNNLLPVRIEGQTVAINSEAFFIWMEHSNQEDAQYIVSVGMRLTEKEPVITLLEDGVRTRSYVLQTEDGEDFSEQFFLICVRLGVIGKPPVPVVQIDGYISESPVDRPITVDDAAYRMEGHFLACGEEISEKYYEKTRGQELTVKGLAFPGYTTPANVRLIGICPACGKSFAFHSYAFYAVQSDVAYSDDGLDCCELRLREMDKHAWSCEINGKTFRYYNSFCCPHCGEAYIDYKTHPELKVFGVSGCVHIGHTAYCETEATNA